jgi:hypothetical protein
MTEQIASGFFLVGGLFVAAALAGYVLLQRPLPSGRVHRRLRHGHVPGWLRGHTPRWLRG